MVVHRMLTGGLQQMAWRAGSCPRKPPTFWRSRNRRCARRFFSCSSAVRLAAADLGLPPEGGRRGEPLSPLPPLHCCSVVVAAESPPPPPAGRLSWYLCQAGAPTSDRAPAPCRHCLEGVVTHMIIGCQTEIRCGVHDATGRQTADSDC